MNTIDRRLFLRASTAAVVAACAPAPAPGPGSNSASEGVGECAPADAAPMLPTTASSFADALLAVSTTEVVDWLLAELARGTSARVAIGGLALAVSRAFDPETVHYDLHAVYALQAAVDLATDGPASEALVPIFWAVYHMKEVQGSADYPDFPDIGDVELPPLGEAAARFEEAVAAGDGASAELAVVRLFRGREEAALREVLARQAGADLGQAWHKIIQVRHLFPLLQEIGWANAELPLRSAARVVAVAAEFGGEFPANRVLAAGMGAAALSGSRDDAAVSQLLETMRVGDSATIALAARDMLLACVAPESIWDAARLFAIECMMNNSFAMGRHYLTGTSAFRETWRSLPAAEDRVVHLLQAASGAAYARSRSTVNDTLIDALVSEPGGTLDDIFAAITGTTNEDIIASSLALGWLDAGGSPDELIARWRAEVYGRNLDYHYTKFLHAVWTELPWVSPAWHNRFLAASLLHAPPADAESWDQLPNVRVGIAALFGC